VAWLRILNAMLSLRRSVGCDIFAKTDALAEVTEEELGMGLGYLHQVGMRL
jgi:hypothetical protein